MTILEMIKEWENGCSNDIGRNGEICQECTLALIRAIKDKAESEK